MAIYSKTQLEPYLKELESYYWNVRRALECNAPDPGNAHFYHSSPDSFSLHYSDVDMDKVERELARFKATVDGIKQLKKKSVKKVHSP
jgi:hypothetical protein